MKLTGKSDQRQTISPPTFSNKPTSIKLLPQRPPMLQRSKKLVPSIDVSVQQTLNEHPISPLVIEQKSEQNSAVKQYASEPYASYNILSPRARTTLKADFHSPRTGSDESSGSRNVRNKLFIQSDKSLKFSISFQSPHLSHVERDKSSKRKSNLNRSTTDESTEDSKCQESNKLKQFSHYEIIYFTDHLARRRLRRELEGTKSLIPRVEALTLNRKCDLPAISSLPTSMRNASSKGMYSPVERLRSTTLSPKNSAQKSHQSYASDQNTSDGTSSSIRSIKSTNWKGSSQSSINDTKYLQKNKRLLEVSHKMEISKERTKAELAKIEGITAKCNNSAENCQNVCDLNSSSPSGSVPQQVHSSTADAGNMSNANTNHSDSLVINKPFQKKDRISFFDDNFLGSKASTSTSSSFFKDRKRSHSTEEKYTFCDAILVGDDYATTKQNRPSSTSSELYLAPKKSPNLRRKSSEDGITNHIVSILKKKDHNESSSASSNASPVTFSSSKLNVQDRWETIFY